MDEEEITALIQQHYPAFQDWCLESEWVNDKLHIPTIRQLELWEIWKEYQRKDEIAKDVEVFLDEHYEPESDTYRPDD